MHEQIRGVLKCLKKEKPELLPSTARSNEISDKVLTKALTTKLSQYPTSLEADKKLMQEGNLSKRHRMAVEVRSGEKMLLQEVKASLPGNRKDEIKEGDIERPTKRQKTQS